jgi:run domain Beclin-1 interacting cysteine-rich containing protein
VDPEADMKDATELRGTLSWAPPRPQIVLTVRNKPKSKSAALSQQKWMCAGCGMRVERQYSKSFRFCHYLGRYFCTGCHSNSTALIPARVIYNWDFKKYAVSNFSMDILSKMFQEPLFNIRDLSPDLLKKIEKLKNVASARNQLTKLKRYISSCRIAGDVKVLVLNTSVPDPDMYSIQDLSQTRAGQLGPAIRSVVSKGLNHVKSCDLCQARAHICEGCHASNTIFPFQVGVWECSECGACYHRSCYRPTTGCGRCVRKHLRQQAQPEMC